MNKRRLILLTVCVVLAVAVLFVGRWLRPYDLNTERAAARAAGVPLSEADFPQTPIPDARNAVLEYNEMARLSKQRPVIRIPAIDKPFVPREQTVLLRRELLSRPDFTALVHRGASKPELFARHIWSPDEVFPYYAQMREAAKWIRRESLLLARDGHYPEAVRNQALGFNIARQAGMDPPLIGYLVSINVEKITLAGMEDILREAGSNAQAADAVRATINAYRPTYDLTQSLRAETMMGMTVFAEVRASAAQSYARQRGGSPRDNPYVSKFWLKPNEAAYLHWMTAQIAASRLAEPKRLAEMKRIGTELDRLLARKPISNPSMTIVAVLFPVVWKADASELQTASMRTVVSSAASVLAYRARHGKYPATLEQADAPLPVDYQTNRPLAYKVTGNGFEIAAHPDTSGLEPERARSLTESLRFQYPLGAK